MSNVRIYFLILFSHSLFFLPLGAQQILNIERQELMIPLRDSVQLGSILYRPADTSKTYPAIVYRTPYGIDSYDSYAELPRKAAHRGYLVFLVDVRGRYRSEGEFEAYRNEKKDGYDVIEWIAQHPGCNGQVVSYGGSYPGIVQWMAMSEKPPHLVAAAPEMTPISSHHFFYNGGAFSMTWLDWFIPYIFADKRKKKGDRSGTWDEDEAEQAWSQSDRRRWYAHRPLNDLTILQPHAPEFFEWLNHPDQSDWWDFVNMEEGFENFVVPVFLLSGWYDASYGVDGASRAMKKIIDGRVPQKVKDKSVLILGPWNHTSITTQKTRFGAMDFGPAAGLDYDELLLHWFDHITKGKSIDWTLDRVNIFVMGANKWKTFNKWPPEESSQQSWYLNKDNALSPQPEKSTINNSYMFDPTDPFWDNHYEKSIPYDQRENESRSDVLAFTSDPLQEDLELIGEVIARLSVSSTAPDTDFSITLSDVYPDGRSINLTGLDAGYLRMRYREGFGEQKLIEAGEIYQIEIRNLYTANVFKKGHRIRLSITSSKAPHYDVNPNTGREIASETELKTCRNTVYFGAETPSLIVFPVVERP